MREIKILVVDDNAPFRDVLTRYIGTFPDMTLVGTAGDGRDAVAMSVGLRPDVVLMDLSMRDMDGFEATRLLKQALPRTAVIALTAHNSKENERLSIEAGADAFLAKGEAADRLIAMIRERAPEEDDGTSRMPS